MPTTPTSASVRFALIAAILSCLPETLSFSQDRKAVTGAKSEFRITAYLPDYRADSFDADAATALTDLILFSVEPDAGGSIDMSRLNRMPWEKLHALKKDHGVRLILCVGGWGRSSNFAAVTKSDAIRPAFVASAVKTCLDHKLDGLDIDWEHPHDAAEEAAYGKLLAELHEAFKPHGLLLSATIAGWQRLPKEGIEAVDAVNIMAYDQDGRHSTFEGATADVKRVTEMGVPAAKIVLGMPFYGRDIKNRRRAVTYREIVTKHHPAVDVDEIDGVYFNGPAMIAKKTEFAKSSGLKGGDVLGAGAGRGGRGFAGAGDSGDGGEEVSRVQQPGWSFAVERHTAFNESLQNSVKPQIDQPGCLQVGVQP